GLYDAKLDGAPVLAITGQTYHDQLGMHYQQEINLLGLFEDVADFNQQAMGPEHVSSLVDVACRTALDRRGVAHIPCPTAWREKAAARGSDSPMQVEGHTSRAWSPPVFVPPAASLERAAALLNDGKKTATLIRRFGDLAGPAVRPATRATPCPASGRYARTRRSPDRAATSPARSHDGDATNFAAATRSPPSC